MRGYRILPLVAGLTLALFLGACSDSSTEAGDTLNQQEAEVMMDALLDASGGSLISVGVGFSSPMPEGVAANESFQWEDSLSCTGGGSVEQSGTISISNDFESISWDLTETHADCRGSASDGSTWTFNGNPNLSSSFEMTGSDTQFSMNGSQQGGIAWSKDGRSGSCSVDLSYSATGTETGTDSATITFSLQGTVCGNSISISETDVIDL
ncbi:MAG: hypothetical protein EA352_00120 [Gemmatimonadales bacterium]|nr:MAG: hypothetical protein EA352_00120 [Gemmatimonadales bacterium]